MCCFQRTFTAAKGLDTSTLSDVELWNVFISNEFFFQMHLYSFISDVSFPCCFDILNLNAGIPAFSVFFSLSPVLSLLHVCSGLRKCVIYYLDSAFQKCQNEIWMFAYYTSIYIGVRYVLKSSETFVFV